MLDFLRYSHHLLHYPKPQLTLIIEPEGINLLLLGKHRGMRASTGHEVKLLALQMYVHFEGFLEGGELAVATLAVFVGTETD